MQAMLWRRFQNSHVLPNTDVSVTTTPSSELSVTSFLKENHDLAP